MAEIQKVAVGIIFLGGSIYLLYLTRYFFKLIGQTIINKLLTFILLSWFITFLTFGFLDLFTPAFFVHYGFIVIFGFWLLSLFTFILIMYIGIRNAAGIFKLFRVNEKDLLKEIIDHAPIGIYTINNCGIIDSFNPKMVELAGANNADEVIGMDALSMPSYKNVGLDNFFRAGLEGKEFETEVHYVSQTGKKESWRHYRGVPLYSVNGDSVARLLLMVSDITHQKELEFQLVQNAKDLDEEVLKRTQNLELLSTQYKSVIEGSLIAFYVLQDDVFKYVNQVFLSIFGYEKSEELVDKSWHVVVPDEEIPYIIRNGLLDRMVGKGKSTRYTFRGKRKDGTIIDVETLSSPSTFEGKPAVIGSLQNITDRTRMEQKIQHHIAELEEMNKLMVDRELAMVNLKQQVAELQKKLSEHN